MKVYESFCKIVDSAILDEPDLVSTKYSLLSAAWFWDSRSLNRLADKGSGTDVVAKITKKVNGAHNGLADRIKYFQAYYALLDI